MDPPVWNAWPGWKGLKCWTAAVYYYGCLFWNPHKCFQVYCHHLTCNSDLCNHRLECSSSGLQHSWDESWQDLQHHRSLCKSCFCLQYRNAARDTGRPSNQWFIWSHLTHKNSEKKNCTIFSLTKQLPSCETGGHPCRLSIGPLISSSAHFWSIWWADFPDLGPGLKKPLIWTSLISRMLCFMLFWQSTSFLNRILEMFCYIPFSN